MKQSRRCILEIDTRPVLHGYFHNASMLCVVLPKVKFNDVDAEAENLLFERNKKISTSFLHEASLDKDAANIEVRLSYDDCFDEHEKVIRSSDACYLYNYADTPISCSVKIRSFRWCNQWCFSGIRVAQGDDKNYIDFRIGFAPQNKIAVKKTYVDHEENDFFENKENYCFVKVTVRLNKILCYMSADGEIWNEYLTIDNYIPKGKRKIGYYSWLDHNRFKNWFYTNYIQLHAGLELEPFYDVKLDYYIGIQRSGRYNIYNPWIDQFIIDGNMVNHFPDVYSLLMSCIDNGKYISLMLNEKYIPSSFAYSAFDYDHQNLIYGYDNEKKVFYLLGYDKHQHFNCYELTFDMFADAYKNLTDTYDITLIQFKISEFIYDMDISVVCKMLREYRFNIDSSYREELNINQKLRTYGIQIYDVCLRNVHKLSDQRISYIISEHKKLMVYRIEYFKTIRVLNDVDYLRLHDKIKEIENLSSKLVLMCLKYRVSKNIDLLDNISNLIITIKENDMKFVDDLIQTLERMR